MTSRRNLAGGKSAEANQPRARFLLLFLKLLISVADNTFVRRSALITGLSLTFGGLALAGIGEWAASQPDNATPGFTYSASLLSPNYGHTRQPGSASALPDLPTSSEHLPGGPAGYTFRHDVPEVRLQFRVADEKGRLVRDISSADVEVFDNQAEVQHFTGFERDDDLPLELGLVIDTSDSIRRVLPLERRAALQFLDRALRPRTDRAFVVGFGGDVRTWQYSTDDRRQLADAIDQQKEPGWGTRVFDALYSACTEGVESASDRKLHRALIVLTDGYDTDSLHTLNDVIAAAQRSETEIYALTIHSNKIKTRGDLLLQSLADGTGGRLYVAASAKDLDSAFSQIEQDLRTQYSVSFPPQQLTPGYHSLRVEVRAPKKLQIHARQGYYALQQ